MEFEPTVSFSKGLEPFIHVRKSYKTTGSKTSEEHREATATASATARINRGIQEKYCTEETRSRPYLFELSNMRENSTRN